MSTQVDADLTVLATGSDLLSLAASHAFAGDGGAFSLVDSLQTASVNPSFRVLFSSTADGKKEDNKVVLTTISAVTLLISGPSSRTRRTGCATLGHGAKGILTAAPSASPLPRPIPSKWPLDGLIIGTLKMGS